MKIYTRQGDEGQTSLYGGQKVAKNNRRVCAYGALDELNAAIGCAVSQLDESTTTTRLTALKTHFQLIQNELFNLGAELATPDPTSLKIDLVSDSDVARLEAEIDVMEQDLPPLKTFILPSGAQPASSTHFARAVCRRAEREIIGFHLETPVRGEVIRYMNRVGDYLFVAARWINHHEKRGETKWSAKK